MFPRSRLATFFTAPKKIRARSVTGAIGFSSVRFSFRVNDLRPVRPFPPARAEGRAVTPDQSRVAS
jgi:hypothetical protein